jgi:hypothetical protein
MTLKSHQLLHVSALLGHLQAIVQGTNENIRMKAAQTWTPQKKNNPVTEREEVLFSNKHILV